MPNPGGGHSGGSGLHAVPEADGTPKGADTPSRNGLKRIAEGASMLPTGRRESSQSPASIVPGTFKVIRRNGKITSFDRSKISVAITKAFLSVEGGSATASTRIHETVDRLTDIIFAALARNRDSGQTFHIEDIQDQVELALMRDGHRLVARSYVIYREERAKQRKREHTAGVPAVELQMVNADGSKRLLDFARIGAVIQDACAGIDHVSVEKTMEACTRSFYDGMRAKDVHSAMIISARQLVEKEPNYSYVSARLLLDKLRCEVFADLSPSSGQPLASNMSEMYVLNFRKYINRVHAEGLIADELKNGFDLDTLATVIDSSRDLQFNLLGLQTLYDRYFLHVNKVVIELPQYFFMRVAMGLAVHEADREKWAGKFYHVLSTFSFVSSTPTLFNSGTKKPQLSSCYLTTVPDSLEGIYSSMRDNALLSKFSGGLGNDWTRVRALGASIRGTNGESQGIVPFLKVANDTAVAVNQGGKRKGAVCGYLEIWHMDIHEFLDLRKNTGDDRRRTHDMNTAVWVPDLFMRRVLEEGDWTLFSPDETGDLHELYGDAFEIRYLYYENAAKGGKIRKFKVLPVLSLWRKLLGMIYETGHPWITFKDTCNLRSPQQHAGVIHSSNLCTEITLNTSDDEIAVCNLGSVNLVKHLENGELSYPKLQKTIQVAMRMLDNVIDLNYYALPSARDSNLRHRPVGLGLMGFQDALYELGIPYQSDRAVDFADESMEVVSYCAIAASCDLVVERGSYQTFQGSLWSKGVLPIHSLHHLDKIRGETLEVDFSSKMDWDDLSARVKEKGMRNSNVLAIAPTATIAGICGVTQSIEPTYQNLFVKSNLSGEFTVINSYLVEDLRAENLWDEVMVNDLKYYNGSIQKIGRIPQRIKDQYLTAFEIDPAFLINAASRRQKWIDQSQSLNIYMDNPSGKQMDAIYKLAWRRGLKTTYYLRSLGSTHVEKSTVGQSSSNLNAVAACVIGGDECEVCQ